MIDFRPFDFRHVHPPWSDCTAAIGAANISPESTGTKPRRGRTASRICVYLRLSADTLLLIKRWKKGQISAKVIHRHHLVAAQPGADGTGPMSQDQLFFGQGKADLNGSAQTRLGEEKEPAVYGAATQPL